MPAIDLSGILSFCAHEHWGSIEAIGKCPEGYRADVCQGVTPARPVNVLDIVLDTYLGWFMSSVGDAPDALAQEKGYDNMTAWFVNDSDRALHGLAPMLARHTMSGAYQCTRLGIKALCDIDLGVEPSLAWRTADHQISSHYRDLFEWYQTAMRKMKFSALVRPVHPEFYMNVDDDVAAHTEKAFTHTVMRIDPLVQIRTEQPERRNALASAMGIDPVDAKSWRDFIGAIFDLASRSPGFLGIKQALAYVRSLYFAPVDDGDVVWRGDLNAEQETVFQNWVVRECCKQAHDRGLPFQIHVGTHNITRCNPMPLNELSAQFPNMNIVMLHCWPFIRECGWLAKHRPNIYIDTCWQPILSPHFLRESLEEWVNYVPTHKIMCSHDATTVEMAAGSAVLTRQIVAESMERQHLRLGLPEPRLMDWAHGLLHGNASTLYKVKEHVR